MTTIDYAIRVAVQLQNAGILEQADAILQSILNVNPAHANALHLSGVIAYQLGKTPLAIQLIENAIEYNPAVAVFHSNLGEIYRILKAIDLSIQCGKRAVELDPNSAVALSNLGIAYYDAKQYDDAESCHKRALTINPKLSCSLNNMGSIYKAVGKIQQAIAFYQAAIAASPHYIEPYNNLGIIFSQQQEFKQALEYLNRALVISPNAFDVHCNIGLVLLGLSHADDALRYFDKALQLKPNYAEAFYGIAKVLLHKHDFNNAEQTIRKAIEINPQHVEFYQLLATISHEQGNPTQALLYLDQALLIDSTHINLYISKGGILMDMGDITGAEAQFLKIAEDPIVDNRVQAHYCLVQLRKTKPNNPSFQALLSIERNFYEVSLSKLVYLYFALGKCYDDIGEWSKAFEYFSRGCNLKRKQITYNIADYIQFTHKLIHCFTQSTIEHLRAFANPSALPIFIVGMPRSGSTLVEQVLASHPAVYGAGELKYFTELIQWPIESLRYPENILRLLPENFRAIIDKYLFHLRRISSEATHITDKMPYNFVAIGLIHALFPNAKIIHIKRNPIDTCLSCYTKLFNDGQLYSYDLTELGEYYQCYERIMAHWRQVLPTNAWLDISYEDITQNFETEARRLIAYCDLSWDPACLAFYESKRQVRTASFMQVRQPIYKSSVNGWHRYKNELAPLVRILNQDGSQSVAQQQA